jgi:integrase/recombinase XerD
MGRPSRHKVHNESYQREATEYRNYLLLLGHAEETCQSRYLYLKEFFNWLEGTGIYQLKHITAVEISGFYGHIGNRESTRTKEKLRPKTVHDIMRCVQTFLGHALDMGKLKTDPASHLKFSCPDEDVERRIFTQAEIKELYQATQTEQETAILHIAYGCGLRVQEISDLNKEDVRLAENLVIVQKGKNGKRRLVPITDRAGQDLELFLSNGPENNRAVFLNTKGRRMGQWTLNGILKKLILRTNFGKGLPSEELKKMGIHSLRHSIATHLLQNGMKLEQVRQFLGHSHIESTEVYTHISQEQINELER